MRKRKERKENKSQLGTLIDGMKEKGTEEQVAEDHHPFTVLATFSKPGPSSPCRRRRRHLPRDRRQWTPMRAPMLHPFQEFFDHLTTGVRVTALVASLALAAMASVALAAAVAAAVVIAALVSLLRRRVSSF